MRWKQARGSVIPTAIPQGPGISPANLNEVGVEEVGLTLSQVYVDADVPVVPRDVPLPRDVSLPPL